LFDKLKIIDIEKRFLNFYLSVNFSVKDKEFLSLLGPSGSGKTTLLHIIGGFVTPDSGTILKDGEDITHLPPNKRHIGIVFQDYALFPYLTVFGNIAFGLRLRKNLTNKEVAKRVQDIAKRFGIEGILSKYPDMISGGEKQRVALARAMIVKPDILLMDEPLSSLDAKIREKLMEELKRFHNDFGITIIYVTHDQSEAMYLSDRIALLNHGRIDQIGTPMELYEKPETKFAREFIGKMNVLELNGKTVYIREENVKIKDDGNYCGIVQEIIYQGATAEVIIRTDFGIVKALDFLRNLKKIKKGNKICFDFEEVLYGDR
jgi:ABC-type Fe3+/spermidine/putrescine transport system ATPase subunit